MGENGPRYKIPRVAEKYGLADIEDELVRLRTGEDPLSLRNLARYFNERLLEVAMREAGIDALEGEVENVYRLLTSDETSTGVRTETKKKLERDGINVAELQSDFVSYQAVRTYLREKRDATYERQSDDDRVEQVNRSIARLRSRTTAVTEEKLSQLERTGRIDLGEFRVLLDLRIFCEDCGAQYEVGDLLEEGGCDCERASSSEGT